ncbi:MAG: SMC family ATPase [Chloroflexi bacterium]|nr:SMC family ATPase [Chloroflexota bacterium]
MIPVKLQLRGFLSYKEPVELSFEGFDLACISGDNGAGKSSLLDAITWVLFGKARRNDDGVINNTCDMAEVIYLFEYENDLYRVQRIKPRNRSMVLEFQMRGQDEMWKILTEHNMIETQGRINETLHLDYDTFINASFFLQGKADEFTQKNSTQRKEILAGILGMDVWERYRDLTREARRALENRMRVIEGSLFEIEAELALEEQRKAALAEARDALKTLEQQRQDQQKNYDRAHKLVELIQEQRNALDELENSEVELKAREAQISLQMEERQAEEKELIAMLHEAEQVKQAFSARMKLKEQLQKMDALASHYYELQQKKAGVEQSVAVEESRLSQELRSLDKEKNKIEQMNTTLPAMEKKRNKLAEELVQFQQAAEQLAALNKKAAMLNEQKSALQAENNTLRDQMAKLKERQEKLEQEKGSTCPLCGQRLSVDHRQQVLADILQEGSQAGDRHRANEKMLKTLGNQIDDLNKEMTDIQEHTTRARALERELGVLESEIARFNQEIDTWQKEGAKKRETITSDLQNEHFARDLRKQITGITHEMEKLGYDAALHETYRKEEQASRTVEKKQQELLIADNRLVPLQREMKTLQTQLLGIEQELKTLHKKRETAEAKYQQEAGNSPNVDEIKERLDALIEAENQQRTEVGGAQQLLVVIDQQKKRKQDIQADLRELNKEKTNFLLLEKAFGRDGVQALLMEEALPQMQMQANDILGRLSSGSMSVRFETEREYKDKKRDDKMQVLDILINDAEGVQRPYDLFSGGEAFRINFAIRLALSKVLAQRAGARLQMLVIDEGFGSQDAEGRQKLIEAINMIRPDFKKILVITHLEELKDAFQARIEVRKTKKGSVVEVIEQ